MPLRIVRNDITLMTTEAIVNTSGSDPRVGDGCERAIYSAAGEQELMAERLKFGHVDEGDVFLTQGYGLKASYIIHAVSPLFVDGKSGEEDKLRSCYRKSLELAYLRGIRSIAFPVISAGSFGYPINEAVAIAVDEICSFENLYAIEVYLVVFNKKAVEAARLHGSLDEYITNNYVEKAYSNEYQASFPMPYMANMSQPATNEKPRRRLFNRTRKVAEVQCAEACEAYSEDRSFSSLDERLEHMAGDTFAQYLLYIIEQKGMTNAEVYNNALVTKKVFSKIKNNPEYHPSKSTVLRLCIGARLNIDETRDMLARAGYALSPYDKADVIYSYFIENGIYDMIEIDIEMEERGLPTLIA